MGARHITLKETIAVIDLLKEHTSPAGEGLCEYKDDFDDARIAAMVSGDLSKSSVAKVRTEVFGKLYIRGNGDPASVLLKEFAELTGRYNKLLDMLSVNRVVDVRHLKMPGAAA
jgi:hypothetical protein